MNNREVRQSTDFGERLLVIVLRVSGVVLLTALIPVVMPFAWMDEIHRQLGMGDLPNIPIMGYLTRSLSAMYALHGALVLFVSLDVRRYLPVVRFLAVAGMLFGICMLLIDLAIGIPFAWTVCEGPFVVVLGILLLWLAAFVPPPNASSPAAPPGGPP